MDSKKILNNTEMTKEEYLKIMNRVTCLGGVIVNTHGHLEGMKIIEEYQKLRNELQNARVIDSNSKHR